MVKKASISKFKWQAVLAALLILAVAIPISLQPAGANAVGTCAVTISMDSPLSAESSARVNISGYGTYSDNATVSLPSGSNVSWSLTVNGQTGPWRTFPVPAGTGTLTVGKGTDFCQMAITGVPAGGQVAISGTGNVSGSVVLPKGSTISWHLTVGSQTGPWYTKTVDNTALDVTQFCVMKFKNIPSGGSVAISGTGGGYTNSDNVTLPTGINVSWDLTVNGQTSQWYTKPVDCTPLDTSQAIIIVNAVCNMKIKNIPAGGRVNISGTGAYDNTTVLPVTLPSGINISWSVTANGQTGPWITKKVDCTDLDASTALCNMNIKNVPAGGKVNISGTGSFDRDQAVTLPSGINISWSVTVNGQTGPWIVKKVDCTDLDASTALCNMIVNNASGGIVAISGTGNVIGSSVVLPKGINVSWHLTVGGQTGPWITKNVDCTALDVTQFCLMLIMNIPTGGTVAISGTGSGYTNGFSVTLPTGINISWNRTVGSQTTAWKTKYIDGSCTPLDASQ